MNCEKCSTEFTSEDLYSLKHRHKKHYGQLCRKCYEKRVAAEARIRYKEKDPERKRRLSRESAKRKYYENPERFKNKKQWRDVDPEGWRAWSREYSRRYRAEHPEQIKATKDRFVKRHGKSYVNAQVLRGVHRRRAKLRGSKFDTAAWELLKQEYDFTCLWCQQREPEILLTPDHVVPVSRGGADTIDNIQPLCLGCNQRKNARDWDFRRILTY